MPVVKLRWGEKIAEIEVPEDSLSSHEIAQALQWTPEQCINLTVVSLKGPKGELLFSQDSQVPTITSLDKANELLEGGCEYELVLHDMRQAQVSQLSETQIEEIKKQFEQLDKDGSGEISITEAEHAFQKKMDDYFKRVDNLKRIALNKAKTDAEKATAEQKYESMKERERAFNLKRLNDLKSRDTNGDAMISWEEYLTSEAPVILSRDSTRRSL